MKALAAISAAVAALSVAASTPPASPSAGRIVFAADRAATTYGEIYRVAADGTVTNLSRSPAPDLFPVASPDGTHVAFARVRLDSVQVYVVGSDGRGLRALSPQIPTGYREFGLAAISWSPDGQRLAVVLSGSHPGTLYVAGLHGGWRTLAHGLAGAAAAWSPDGTMLAFKTTIGIVRVASTVGQTRWTTTASGTMGWSRHGQLAVQQRANTIAVYDPAGHRQATVPGSTFAWQPAGDALAVVHDRRLELRPRVPGATAATIRTGSVEALQWMDAQRVRWFGPDGWRGYDLRTRRVSAPAAGATSFDAVVSASGAVAYTKQGQPTQSLMRAGAPVRTAPWCGDDLPFESIQFLGRTNALVYQSGCAVPSADIYSVAPDGSGLQHVTETPQHEFSPSLSPDGSRVAYAQQVLADRCEGCPQSLWVTPSKQLTARAYTDDAPFDDHPSWSPDSATIGFDRSGANTPPTLYTIPAAGGTGKSLGVQGTHPVWGPKLIAFDSDGGLATLDPATGDVKTVAGTRNRNVVAAAWSSDGRLAYLTPGRITIAGGPTIPVPKPHATALAWSPDGTRFAFAAADTNGNGEIYTIAVDGSGLRQVTKDLDVIAYDGSIGWR